MIGVDVSAHLVRFGGLARAGGGGSKKHVIPIRKNASAYINNLGA